MYATALKTFDKLHLRKKMMIKDYKSNNGLNFHLRAYFKQILHIILIVPKQY